MVKVTPSGKILGATVEGIDLAQPLSARHFVLILNALGEYGVLRFPRQQLDSASLKRFAEHFGSLQAAPTGGYHEPGMPEVMLLSNIVRDGKAIGLADAGQDWHTDMSYNRQIGFVNVLHAVEVPMREGKTLGATMFANMQAAYEDLPQELKTRLADAVVTHDFNKFWEKMRLRPGSERAPLTAEQRRKLPPSQHPVFLVHPLTGRKVLYANPGYAIRIEGMAQAESDRILALLFAHQLQPKYQYTHIWSRDDVLVWDHIGTLHYAIPDYGPAEHRLMKRCQVIADRVFEPGFLEAAREAAANQV